MQRNLLHSLRFHHCIFRVSFIVTVICIHVEDAAVGCFHGNNDLEQELFSESTTISNSNSQLSDSYKPSQTITETEDSDTDEERYVLILPSNTNIFTYGSYYFDTIYILKSLQH